MAGAGAGIRLALATDNMHADMIEVMRWALNLGRIQTGGIDDGWQPADMLRMATYNGAQAMGLGEHLGSLEAGKLADLVILDADPSADIRNSDKISKVMIGGRLYDAATLNEEITGTRKRKPYFWEQSAGSEAMSAQPGADFGHGDR